MSQTYKVKLVDGREAGPLPLEEIASLLAGGQLHADSPVFDPDVQRWKPLRFVLPETLGPVKAPATSAEGTPWEAPASPLDEEKERQGPYGADWLIALGLFLFFLLIHLAGRSEPPRGMGDAEASGYACGQFLFILVFPAAFLILRKWWSRLKSVLACGGCLLLMMVIGVVAAVAIPALLRARQSRRAVASPSEPVSALSEYRRAHPMPWLSLEVPGDLTEGEPLPVNFMVARSTHQLIQKEKYRVEMSALEMLPGFKITLENAIREQRQALLKAGIPAGQISPDAPVNVDQGKGRSFTYWVQAPNGPRVAFTRIMLAFPANSPNPTRGLALLVGGAEGDDSMKAMANRMLSSVEYKEPKKALR